MSKFMIYLMSVLMIAVITSFATLALYPTLATPVSPAAKNSAAATTSVYATDPSQPFTQSTGTTTQTAVLTTQVDPMVQTSFQNIVIVGLVALIIGLIAGVGLGHQAGRK